MSNSTTQPQEEVSDLAEHIKQLDIEISFAARRSLSVPAGSRHLSLSPYRRVMSFLDEWEEQTKNSSPVRSVYPENSEGEYDAMGDSESSDFKLPPSIVQEEEEKLEHERCRVLGILKCFLFNLDKGTLPTGDVVDESLKEALGRLVALSEARDALPEQGPDSEEVEGGGEDEGSEEHSNSSSDEQMQVVEMVEGYIRLALRHRGEVCSEVVDFAKKILGWAPSGDANDVAESTEDSKYGESLVRF
ncbi:uncharacterized protein L3040_007114 [Drepanopeziza brunnea f. sp. 'multigermtubi']|uniref:Uncharacterized protein n=1 Tax=Marssonina brunnea f. sp. multigermtubi (strain MB_m1) TaxID=1072389 RepID=K1WL99_MARBU|nr:uncharacterized protein MBM_08794 [Drepanopeziza brunnea f. sp. 'multigermtubi' MB_m1]EKD13032.1 hypothetical protein MBM_08794 [Drepanopeziza brunnea f. sp. 'multigermtubi' MB_m1]KAJ5038247.1 hypothetical protein L3040_007114 [Drepanopeziza brunnea f. sp. 'multigermtubi']